MPYTFALGVNISSLSLMTLYYRFPRVCLTNRVCSHGVSTEGQDILPGVTYSLDQQCAMYFGEGYTYYVYVSVVCSLARPDILHITAIINPWFPKCLTRGMNL